MKKMGRPEKQINQQQFEALCQIQATEEEVCLVLGVQPNTLNKWCRRMYGQTFCKVFAEKRALGKASLRRKQFKLAEKSAAMAIWLGKQYLGQREVQGIELTGKDGDAIEMKAGVQIYLPDNQREETK